MSAAHVVLGLLSRGQRHGYELKRDHDQRFPQARPLAFGQVYATLSRLTRDGYVTAVDTAREGGPDRTTFALTAAGRDHLAQWLAGVEPPAPYVSSGLFTKVVIALLASGSGAMARRYLGAQRSAHLARMREFTAIKTDPDAALADVLAADHALAHLDADLRWMDIAMSRVDQLRTEVLR